MKRQFQLTFNQPSEAEAPPPRLSNSAQFYIEGLREWLESQRLTPKTKKVDEAMGLVAAFAGEQTDGLTRLKLIWAACGDDQRKWFKTAMAYLEREFGDPASASEEQCKKAWAWAAKHWNDAA